MSWYFTIASSSNSSSESIEFASKQTKKLLMFSLDWKQASPSAISFSSFHLLAFLKVKHTLGILQNTCTFVLCCSYYSYYYSSLITKMHTLKFLNFNFLHFINTKREDGVQKVSSAYKMIVATKCTGRETLKLYYIYAFVVSQKMVRNILKISWVSVFWNAKFSPV